MEFVSANSLPSARQSAESWEQPAVAKVFYGKGCFTSPECRAAIDNLMLGQPQYITFSIIVTTSLYPLSHILRLIPGMGGMIRNTLMG